MEPVWGCLSLLWTLAFRLCGLCQVVGLIVRHWDFIVSVRQAWEFLLPQRKYAMLFLTKIWHWDLILSVRQAWEFFLPQRKYAMLILSKIWRWDLIVSVRQAWKFLLPQRKYAMLFLTKIWHSASCRRDLVLKAVSLLALLWVADIFGGSLIVVLGAAYNLPSAAIVSFVVSLLMTALSVLTYDCLDLPRAKSSRAPGWTQQNLFTAGLFGLVVIVHLSMSAASVTVVTIGSLLLGLADDLVTKGTHKKTQFHAALLCDRFFVYYALTGLWDLLVALNPYLQPLLETYLSVVIAVLLVASYRKGELLGWRDVCRVVFWTTMSYALWIVLSALVVTIHLYSGLSFNAFIKLAHASSLINVILREPEYSGHRLVHDPKRSQAHSASAC